MFALAAIVAALLPSCGTAYGDVAFYWNFDGIPSCAEARVAEVDVALVNAAGRVVRARTFTCTGDGLRFYDVPAGDYTLLLDAYSFRGLPLYQSETDFYAEPGALTDLGEIRLRRFGAPAEGDLTFEWRFDGERRCSRAGVVEVDVEVLAADGSLLLRETADCAGTGLFLLDLPPGPVDVFLDAYDGRNRLLYLGDAPGRVREGFITDIGVIDLAPVP